MDFSPPAATVFREIGGLSSMIDRLKLEVQAAPVVTPQGAGTSAEAMQTDAAGSSSSAAASSPAGAVLTHRCWAWLHVNLCCSMIRGSYSNEHSEGPGGGASFRLKAEQKRGAERGSWLQGRVQSPAAKASLTTGGCS